MTKVMCFGTFDHFHPGHKSFLKQARQYGDYLIVVIARDQNVQRFKKRLPLQNELERKQSIVNSNLADQVMLGDINDIYLPIEQNNPNVICLGYDQKVDLEKLKSICKCRIIRLKPFKPKTYKSSLLNI